MLFSFPEYYGANLDALYDCLTEISEETRLTIVNCEILDCVSNELMNVFWDAEAQNDMLHVEMERRILKNED